MGIDLEAIKAREKAASPGPWVRSKKEAYFRNKQLRPGGVVVCGYMPISGKGFINPSSAEYIGYYDEYFVADVGHAENMDFVISAREDIPVLIAEVERLRSSHCPSCECDPL